MEDHIRAVETILSGLEMDDMPRLMVLNKMDLVAPEVVANLGPFTSGCRHCRA